MTYLHAHPPISDWEYANEAFYCRSLLLGALCRLSGTKTSRSSRTSSATFWASSRSRTLRFRRTLLASSRTWTLQSRTSSSQDQQNQQAALAQAQKAQTQQDSQIQSSVAGQQQNVDSSVQNQLSQDQQNQQNILNKNQGRHLLKVCLPLQAPCQVWPLRMPRMHPTDSPDLDLQR